MVRIAVAQMDPDVASVEVNLGKAQALIDAAAEQGAELVVLPETALRGQDEDGNAVAHQIPGPAVDELAEMARGAGAWVVMGMAEANPGGKPFNSAVVLDADGALVDVYRKVFLYLMENDGYRPGDKACLLDLGFCTAGLTIYYDYIFPEYIHALVVAAHGFSVFAMGSLLGREWEERKTREIMEREGAARHGEETERIARVQGQAHSIGSIG